VRKSITAPTAVVHLAGIPICERDGGEAPEEGACGKKRHPSAFEETPADLNRLPPARIPPGLSRERERGEHLTGGNCCCREGDDGPPRRGEGALDVREARGGARIR
jgi:hypothetical protein